MMRDRECLMEIQLQFSQNLDSLQDYLAVVNPPDKKTKKTFIHPQLEPIHTSLRTSLATVLEVTEMISVLYPFFLNYDQLVAKALEEDRSQEALELIQQQAAFSRGAAKISRGLLEYLDTTLYEFEEYYNPARVRNIIEYVRIEADPKRRFKLDTITLPKPPTVEIDAEALYRAVGDATEGVVGTFQPESTPYYPIEHVPLSEKLLQPPDVPIDKNKLTAEERNARFKLGSQELEAVRSRRHLDMEELHQITMDKALRGYSDQQLDELGEKFHL